MKNGYKINFLNGTIEVTKAFMKEAETYNSNAYNTLMTLKADLPNMRIVAQGQSRKPRKRDNLTYNNILQFINCQNNAEILLKEYIQVKKLASGQGGSVYQNVKQWFLNTFPNYREIPSFDEEGNLISDFGRKTQTHILPMEQVTTNKQEDLKSA